MQDGLDFGLLAFASLFTMIDPLGIMPLFLTMTQGLDREHMNRIAFKATLTALAILIFIAFTGRAIFEFFGISINSLRIVGGIIFLIIGYDMLQAHIARTKMSDESPKEYADDIAITPLAIPMICGPGAITSMIVFSGDAFTAPRQFALFGALTAVMLITYLALRGAKYLTRVIGPNGSRVLLRLMGLIVMSVAVEFLLSGLTPVLRDIFMVNGR